MKIIVTIIVTICDTQSQLKQLYLVNPSDVSIWIDPLDATKEYVQGLTRYTTVMIGIAVRGEPVIGVIRKPFKKQTFWGLDWPGVFSTVASKPAGAIKYSKLFERYQVQSLVLHIFSTLT